MDYYEKMMNLFRLAEYNELLLNEYKEYIGTFKTIFLFGCGKDGKMVVDYLWDVLLHKEVCFIDHDDEKCGKEIYRGLYCYKPEKMFGCDARNTIVLITTSEYGNQIFEELHGTGERFPTAYQDSTKLGIGTTINKDFVELLLEYTYLNVHKEQWLASFLLLSDDGSKRIFIKRLFRRAMQLYGRFGMDDEMDSESPQYFPPDIKTRLCADEIFLDLGAFTGDTVEEFVQQTRNRFKAIYAFEMDASNFAHLTHMAQMDARIHVFQNAVSESEGIVSYKSNAGMSSSYVFVPGETKDCSYVNSVSMDGLVEKGILQGTVTYIKMDIEGAEMEALHGMEALIKRDKPKLAICVYHKTGDLWEIPLYIHSLVPEYKMILRHHSPDSSETVLYAFE